MLPLQQQRPLIGDGERLGDVWMEGDKFCSMRSPLPVGEGAGVRAYPAQNDSVFWGLGWSTTTFLGDCKPSPPTPLPAGEGRFHLDPFWWKRCFTKMEYRGSARHLGRQVRSFAASQAIRFRRKRTLDYPDVARTIEGAVG